MADRDGYAILEDDRDRLNVTPLLDRPGEVLAERLEIIGGGEDGIADRRDRLGEDECRASVLASDGSRRLEGCAVVLDGRCIGLEILDHRLGAGERLEVSTERRSEVISNAPRVAAGGAEEAEARAARAIGLDGVEVKLGESKKLSALDAQRSIRTWPRAITRSTSITTALPS